MQRWLLLLFVVTLSTFGSFADTQPMGGSTVFIEPMNGFDVYLTAAFTKKHVPLVVVTEKEKADYVIKGVYSETAGASISLVQVQSSRVLFAYAISENLRAQSIAESCAKHLKDFLEKSSH